MKTLTIKDLSVSKALDRKAMSAVRGGETVWGDLAAGPCGAAGDPTDNPFPFTQGPHNSNFRDTLKSLGIDVPF